MLAIVYSKPPQYQLNIVHNKYSGIPQSQACRNQGNYYGIDEKFHEIEVKRQNQLFLFQNIKTIQQSWKTKTITVRIISFWLKV